jgi:hypothetical protein
VDVPSRMSSSILIVTTTRLGWIGLDQEAAAVLLSPVESVRGMIVPSSRSNQGSRGLNRRVSEQKVW